MQIWVTLGLVFVLSSIAGFLVYYIQTALDGDDARTIDPLPPSDPAAPEKK